RPVRTYWRCAGLLAAKSFEPARAQRVSSYLGGRMWQKASIMVTDESFLFPRCPQPTQRRGWDMFARGRAAVTTGWARNGYNDETLAQWLEDAERQRGRSASA